MIIKKISLENIRSYKKLDLEFPQGSVLLSGDIGSGKTSVLLAIEFALFGLQPGQKGSALLREKENSGYVKLEIEIDGKNIVLERKLKRGKSIGQENVSITIDGEKKETSITEMKNFILSLINYPPEFIKKTNTLYKFTVYTPQEEMKQIILEDAENRLNTLRFIFGIDKYKTIKENTFLLTGKLRENIRKKEGIIQDIETKKNNLENFRKSLEEAKIKILELENNFKSASESRKKIQNLILEVQSKIDEKRNLEKEIEKSQIMLASKKENRILLEKENKNLNEQIQELLKTTFKEKDLKDIIEKIESLKVKEEESIKQLTEIMARINSSESRKKEAIEIKEKMSNISICPTCLQSVDKNYKQNVFDKIEKENKISEVLTETNYLLGRKACIITNAGGAGVLCADACEREGIELTKIDEKNKKEIDKIIPIWSRNNPVDIIGDANAERYEKVLKIVEDEKDCDFFIILFTPQSMSEPLKTAEVIAKLKKPSLSCFIGGKKIEEALVFLKKKKMPVFTDIDELVNVAGKIVRMG